MYCGRQVGNRCGSFACQQVTHRLKSLGLDRGVYTRVGANSRPANLNYTWEIMVDFGLRKPEYLVDEKGFRVNVYRMTSDKLGERLDPVKPMCPSNSPM